MGKSGLGLMEIVVVVALFLIFVRPEDMPRILRKVGRLWAKAYYYVTLFKRELRRMEKEIGIEEEMKDIRAINARLNSEIASFNREIRDTVNQARNPELPAEQEGGDTAKGEKDAGIN